MSKNKIQWKPLIIWFLITLGVGGLSAFFTIGNMDSYTRYDSPPLSPPSWLFGVVWPILFILMAISAYLIYTSNASDKDKRNALFLYCLSLFINFFWTIIFFNMGKLEFAFVWLILLWIVVLATINSYKKINKTAAWLQIPYLIWLTFAAYLNLGIAILN